MNTQPEATELAEVLESYRMPSMDARVLAAAELRRLSKVEAQRDALLSALLWINKRCPQAFMDCPLHTIHREMAHDAGACARAAIKKAEGGQ